MEFIAGTIVGVIIALMWHCTKKQKRNTPDNIQNTNLDKLPPSRGSYWSREYGCMVEDRRSDAEVKADANRQRR
jgi:hypothetical protein